MPGEGWREKLLPEKWAGWATNVFANLTPSLESQIFQETHKSVIPSSGPLALNKHPSPGAPQSQGGG